MKTLILLLCTGLLGPLLTPGRADDSDDSSPFKVAVSCESQGSPALLKISLHVPPEHYLYAAKLHFELDGATVTPTLPAPKEVQDQFSGQKKLVYDADFSGELLLAASRPQNLAMNVMLQGCSHESCFFPETKKFLIKPDNAVVAIEEGVDLALTGNKAVLSGFRVVNQATGYLDKEKFVQFLSTGETVSAHKDDLAGKFVGWGRLLVVGMILLGGLALNFTPCVLPLVPVTLAVLGAGAANKKKVQGFALGATYGSGMALVYGALGLIVVLTGAKFGTLNSSPWFNLGIAVVFIVLGLAMFDVLHVDFSKFQRRSSSPSGGNSYMLAASMGSVSALLAGACVAPVVISVLLLSTTLHNKGAAVGLLLPFLLGVGMALPWPFAAAGMSFLPKPGAWMTRVKQVFGVFIVAVALYYAHLGWTLGNFSPFKAAVTEAKTEESVKALQVALTEARNTGKPIFVDFWASWCKNCVAMEHSTFKDTTVQNQLKNFITVKFQAEHPGDPEVKKLLDQFGVMGLPTYAVVVPDNKNTASTEQKENVSREKLI